MINVSIYRPKNFHLLESIENDNDLSEESIALLQSLNYIYRDRVIHVISPPINTKEIVKIKWEYIDTLTKDMPTYICLFDIIDVKTKTNSEVRNFAREQYKIRKDKLKFIIYVTGKNLIMRLAIKYYMAKSAEIPYVVVRDLEQADKIIEDLQKKNIL